MKILLIIIVCLVSIHNRIYAQDCPTGGGPWSSQSTSYDDRYFNYATVGYDYRSIGGNTYEIRINWSTLTNISEFLSDSTMMKILEVKAVKSSIPQIDKYTGKVRVYYEKECKAKIRSIIRVDQSAEVCCPEGMNVL